MGQSKITTDSPDGVLLGRLFDNDVFLHGFRASLLSSITDKVRRDFLRESKAVVSKIVNGSCRLNLLIRFCGSEVVVIGCVHPADYVLASGTCSRHLCNFGLPVELWEGENVRKSRDHDS